MVRFIPGLKLNELFYREAVKPILDAHFPGLKYAAARIDYGSDVLGFDTPLSRDHEWGPQLQMFLTESDYHNRQKTISAILSKELPPTFKGFSTHWKKSADGQPMVLARHASCPIHHRIELCTVRSFFTSYLVCDPRHKIKPIDWLAFPQQKLRTITSGRVFHDDIGLNDVRKKLAYYPQDVWLYMIASQWARIGQDEHLMGRSGDAGDEIGSAIIGARIVRDIMRLCFLMEKQYMPYAKWFGTGFYQLRCAKRLRPILRQALLAHTWRQREKYISMAYEIVAAMHNQLKITPPIRAKVSSFYNRPYTVIWGEKFTEAITKKIKDKDIKQIKFYIGNIDQISDSTDVLENIELYQRMKALFSA